MQKRLTIVREFSDFMMRRNPSSYYTFSHYENVEIDHKNRDRAGGHAGWGIQGHQPGDGRKFIKKLTVKRKRQASIRHMQECLRDDISMAQAAEENLSEEDFKLWYDAEMAEYEKSLEDEEREFFKDYSYEDGYDDYYDSDPYDYDYSYHAPSVTISQYEYDKLIAAEKELNTLKLKPRLEDVLTIPHDVVLRHEVQGYTMKDYYRDNFGDEGQTLGDILDRALRR